MEFGDIRICWLRKMNTLAFPFISWSNSAMPTGIPPWELETRFDFSLHNVHMVDLQMAAKPFDVHEEEGAGSCFLEAYGALGSIKERNNGKGNVSLLHSLRSCEQWISWVLGPWMDMLQVPILFPALSWGPHITFRFILEKIINVVPPSPSHLKGILDYFNYRQYEKPFGTFVVWRCIKRHDCVKSYSSHPSVPHVNFLRLKNREY